MDNQSTKKTGTDSEKESKLVFVRIHRNGKNLKYIKATDYSMSRIINSLLDLNYLIRPIDGEDWDYNIETGNSIEIVTEEQIINALNYVIV